MEEILLSDAEECISCSTAVSLWDRLAARLRGCTAYSSVNTSTVVIHSPGNMKG